MLTSEGSAPGARSLTKARRLVSLASVRGSLPDRYAPQRVEALELASGVRPLTRDGHPRDTPALRCTAPGRGWRQIL